jgi:hypothetical protein
MKAILLFALACALVEGTVDPCPQTDHLYYDKSCCDGATQNCLDGILQTDKDAIDNLVDLKRADGSACTADDALKYSIDEAANFSGVVCADSGPPVNCVGTWSSYGACTNGAKSRTYNVSTPASGGGTACPASPESAACNGTIGDTCGQASHCASNTCDSGTSKCVAAPTFTLVTDDTGWDDSGPKMITDSVTCFALQPDAALLTAIVAVESAFVWDASPTSSMGGLSSGACNLYPKGCFVRLNGGTYKLYYHTGLDNNGVACGKQSNFIADYLPVLLP